MVGEKVVELVPEDKPKKKVGGQPKVVKTETELLQDELITTVQFLKKLKTDYFRNYNIEQVYTRINTRINQINRILDKDAK